MRSEKIHFENSKGDKLAAVIEWPEDERPIGFALFAHCFTCTKNIAAAVNISRALSNRRIAVLRFDFTGLGESEGEFAATGFSHNVEDLVAASSYLAANHQPAQILIGHSLGGAAVLHATGRIDSIRAVATIGAPFHPGHANHLFAAAGDEIEKTGEAQVDIGGRPFTIRKSFVDDLNNQHPEQVISQLSAALMVMHSPLDKVVGIDNAASIYQAAKHPKNFVSLDTADHLLSSKEDSRYAADMIATWAGRYIDQPEDQATPSEVIDNRVTVRTRAGGFFTDMFVNGHNLPADEPLSYGGTDKGPSPYDYLQAALGACTSMTVQMYARRKKWPLEDAVVRLRYAKVHASDCDDCDNPQGKIDRFERELELSGDLSDEQCSRLLEIADKCPVHKTLHGEAQITTSLRGTKE